jgi:RND family efflux transporter MFP subunit
MSVRSLCVWLSCAWLVLAGRAAVSAAEPPEVRVSLPVARQVADVADFTGRADAAARVELRARVSGYLVKVLFKDGADVKEGDVLFDIDPRPYQAELDKAEARLTLSVSRLKRAEADLKRAKALLANRAISQEEFDRFAADRDEAEAAVGGARADREAARLTLGFTKVTAPIAGRIGRRLLDAGNVVKADDTALATLVTQDPLYACFDIDEATLVRVRKAVQEGKLKGAVLVTVGLAGEEGFPHQGLVDFVDNHVDPATGTVHARVVLPNADGLLSPGMFARVRLPVGGPYPSLLVPQAAVASDQGRKYVYVVNGQDVVESRTVTLGPREGELVAVKEGLKAGDRVVVGGLHGLRPGMAVRPGKDAPARKERE